MGGTREEEIKECERRNGVKRGEELSMAELGQDGGMTLKDTPLAFEPLCFIGVPPPHLPPSHTHTRSRRGQQNSQQVKSCQE